MEKQKNIPQLRFPEFTEEWEKKKLEDIGEIVTGSTPPTANHSYYNGDFLFVSPVDIQDNRYVTDTITTLTHEGFLKGRKIPAGSSMFVCIGSTIGKVAQNKQECVTNQQINAILPVKNNSDFVFSLLEFHSGKIKLLSAVQAVPIINKTTFSKYLLYTPYFPEQQKIASFFTSIDQKISQLKRKRTLLEQYKKGVMQKIFSQEIRFKDVNGKEFPKWEKKKLGELTYKVGIKNKENRRLPIYSINNIQGFLPQADQFDGVDSNNRGYDISLYKIIGKHTFAYNPARINVGSIGYSGELNNIIISSLYVCFKTKEALNDRFMLYFLKTYDFYKSVLQNVEGGVRDYLFYENFSNIRINLPSGREQTKIANFLSAIDDKINHTQKQIDKAKVWKKGLMQQMFV